jgi:hypothetical protein
MKEALYVERPVERYFNSKTGEPMETPDYAKDRDY